MNEFITATRTMSSQEIAELTGKQHAHVMRDIRALLEQGVAESNFGLGEYKDKNNQSRPCYNLTKKGCLILASGYDAKLRERIIDRWEALETGAATPSYKLPKTYGEALRELADKVEENERLMLENQHQQQIIEKAKPKVQFAEAVGKCDDTIPVDLMAKLLAQNGVPNMGEKRLFDWLRKNGYISDQRSTWNRPYQKWVERGLFRIEESKWVDKSSGNVHTSYTPRITTKGQQYFVQKFCSNLPQFFGTIQTINNIPT